MMRLLRKAIPVTFQKQATLPTREKQSWRIERMSWIHWYDPKDLISTILSATKLTDCMHFGMALVVDEQRSTTTNNAGVFQPHYVWRIRKDAPNHTNTPDAVLISVQVIVGLQDVLTGEELSQHIGYRRLSVTAMH